MASLIPSVASVAQPHGQKLRAPLQLKNRHAALLLAVAALAAMLLSYKFSWLGDYPSDAVMPAGDFLGAALNYLASDITLGSVSLGDMTRSMAAWLAVPVDAITGLLTDGLFIPLANGGEWSMPGLPWLSTFALLVLGAYALAGGLPAALTAAALGYAVVSGLWQSMLISLVSVLFSVAISVVLGGALGIWAYRSQRAKNVLEPIYDALQTLPVFSYLSIILLLFGFGPVAALAATVVFAMPPMARSTCLALSQLPQSVHDMTLITGCTPHQKLWLVELPASKGQLLNGVNQVIMLSLAMVIIASIIGAGGLGSDVLRNLKSMRMTDALQAGIAITLIAIALDRVSIGWASTSTALSRNQRLWLAGAAVLALLVGAAVRSFSPDVDALPESPIGSFSHAWDKGFAEFNQYARPGLVVIQDAVITLLLRPVREWMSALPWLPTSLATTALAWLVGGRKTALTVLGLLVSIAVLGLWHKAMLSLYLVTVSMAAAFMIGFPIGLWAGLSKRVFRVALLVTDTIQTMPSFVYIIPVVLLFGVGDFPAFLSIAIYSLAPVIRYTATGIQQVPVSLSESAAMSGCTSFQRLIHVLLPMSTPQVLLGLNQAVMLAFGMLVITALVGSRGLEEVTLVALSRVRPGDGLVAGFGIAALAIVVDRLLRQSSYRLAERFGGTPMYGQ